MKLPLLSSLFAVALLSAGMANPSANAADPAPPPEIVGSGPHTFDAVTEITPRIREQFPRLGSLTEQVPSYQLVHGGPDLATVEEAVSPDE